MISNSVNGLIQTSIENINSNSNSNNNIFGKCKLYEEKTIGNERYCILSGCENTKYVTLVIRGSSDHLLKEVKNHFIDEF